MSEIELQKGNRLHELMLIWNEGLHAGMKGYLMMGKAIYFLKQERLWKKEMPDAPTFKYWVEHTLHISVAQAHRLAQVYDEVGKMLESRPIDFPLDIAKVTLLLPYLHGKDDKAKMEMLEVSKNLTVEDLKNTLKDMSGNGELATDVCVHPVDQLEEVTRCKKCGKWLK